MNFGSFEVATAMIHNVRRGNDQTDTLVLTDDPVILDDDLRRYFRHKIVASLTERGVAVIADQNEDDVVRGAIAQTLSDPAKLPAASHTIARRLDAVQTGRNPAGLLAVIVGTLDGRRCAGVLKLEREQGLRFRIRTVGDRQVVDLEFLRNLTLTDKTKVFKTSLFSSPGKGQPQPGTLRGWVSDDQRSREAAAGVASFFLTTFLGCRLRDSPEKSTLQFVQAVDHFINDEVTSAERRGRYQVALLAAMQDQTGEIRPRTFASTQLEAADRPKFLDRIRDIGLDPDQPFAKDTSLVKVSGFRMTFESGMVLVGRQDDLQERVAIRPDDAKRPGVDINDTVKKLSGR